MERLSERGRAHADPVDGASEVRGPRRSFRVGVLSDLHAEPDPPWTRSWINSYEPRHLAARIDQAIEHFREATVELVLLLGDITERADADTLARVFDQVASLSVPIAAVGGNHDCGPGADLFTTVAQQSSILLPALESFTRDGVEVDGVAIERTIPGGPLFRTASAPPDRGRDLRMLASHFPILSEAKRLASAGLHCPGGLLDRREVADRLARGGAPVVVCSGHLHTRCSIARAPLLQLSFGSMIEPPFDCAVVEIFPGARPRVERRSRRLGPLASIDPVFVGERELWEWRDDSWHPVEL